MHIPYESENTGEVEFQKDSLYERFWRFVRFSVVTGMIFVLSFLALNFGAYVEIFSDVFDPEAQAKAQQVLSSVVGEEAYADELPTREVDSSKLLPVLPDKKDVRKKFEMPDLPIVPTDNRLVIPKLGKSVPLVNTSTENLAGENWHELEEQIQGALRDGIVHYPGTARPGQYGNVFLTGHSSYYPWDPGKFKDVFATLGKLEIGDRYYVYYDQQRYVYEIVEKKEVQPDHVEVLAQPKDKKVSTLMTCSPVGTTLRRLILTAEQIS